MPDHTDNRAGGGEEIFDTGSKNLIRHFITEK